MSNISKILLRTRVFGTKDQLILNKKSFFNFNSEYCTNLKRLNININGVNIYNDKYKSTLYSEINIEKSDIVELKREDLFYLLKYKYHKENLEVKVNYLEKDLSNISPDMNLFFQDIFLL